MKSISEMTQGELAAYVDSHLKGRGIDVVLSGGATVAIYSDHKYVSKDVDFVARFSLDTSAVHAAMSELGFERRGRYYFHPEAEYFVDFVAGPLSVGGESIGEFVQLELGTGSLRIIAPTDSVKDRLAAYYHWGDLQSLEQALLVARAHDIDIDEVRRWSKRQGGEVQFEQFTRRLRKLDD